MGYLFVLVAAGCIDPAHEKQPAKRIVHVEHVELSDPNTGEIWAETCGAVGSNEYANTGSQIILPVPLEHEYQVDMSDVSIEGSIEVEDDRQEYCGRSDGYYGFGHYDPACTVSSAPDLHELLSFKVLDGSGQPVTRTSDGTLRISKRGDIHRFRFLSHTHGAVYIDTSVRACTHDAGASSSAVLLFNIVPPDGATP